MRASLWKLIVAAIATTAITASSASASSITFTLDQSATGPTGVGGTITLNDTIDPLDHSVEPANTVDILVQLNANYGFVSTGAGDALAFNLSGNPTITSANITDITAGFAFGPTNPSESPFGTFEYAVTCMVPSGCGHGGSSPNPGPLSFDLQLTGITLDSFVANDGGYYFASDLIGPGPDGTRRTGNMAALDGVTTTDVAPVPEPASLVLLGSGLVCVAQRLRRRQS